MTTASINSVVSQMQALAQQAQGMNADQRIGGVAQPVDFGSELAKGIKKINQFQLDASDMSQRFTQGAPGIGINDVMVNMQKSSVALNMGVQVRNKLVDAYQNIMNINL